MTESGGQVVSELYSFFGLRVDTKSFSQAENALEGLGRTTNKLVGAFAGAFFVREVKEWFDNLMHVGTQLEIVSKRAGLTAQSLQELQFAALMSDVEAGTLEMALRKLSASAYDASQGGKEAGEVYAKLGVSVKDSKGEIKATDQLLEEVANGFQKTENPTERAALAMKVFGRAGTQLVPFLAEGAEGIQKLRKRFNELGGGFDEEFIKNAQAGEEAVKELNVTFNASKSAIGNVLLPAVTFLLNKFRDFNTWLNKVLKNTQFLRIAMIALGVASAVAGVRAITPWLPMIGTFLLIGATITAVIAIIEELYGLVSGRKSLIGKWIDEWKGAGAVADFTNRWAIGIDSLGKSLKTLWQFGNDVIEMMYRLGKTALGKAMGFDVSVNEQKRMAVQQRMADAERGAFNDVQALFSALTNPADQSAVAAGRGVNAPLMGDATPRVAGRGIGAALAKGSVAFGQAPAQAVAGNLGSSSANINQTVNVTVNAPGSDPKIIEHHAKKAVNEAMTTQNRNVRSALAGRKR